MLQFQSDRLSNFLDGNYADLRRKRTVPRTMTKEMKHVQGQENREEEPFRRMFKRSLNQAAGKSKPEEHPLGYIEDLNNVTTSKGKGATRRDWAGQAKHRLFRILSGSSLRRGSIGSALQIHV